MYNFYKENKGKMFLIFLLAANMFFFSLNFTCMKSEAPANYKQDKIDSITDKIIQREVVEDTYLIYLPDEEIKEDIILYNKKTADLKISYKLYATRTVFLLCELDLSESATDYDKIPDDLKEIINKISAYALYANATELILSDSEINQLIAGEIGGSYGAWPWHIHEEALDYEMEDYFILIEKIMKSLIKL
ncbi:hypothetical protein [Anaeropeptidivorans aminofermentans]|uniref:hypothetical protein n=1 Tax=Anaeropeptidivorans aminofermentans TaxID=2934315 RepID=UPI00202415AD|nr:hypothetical protein [Anaeropeptidivorans aminofermentans]